MVERLKELLKDINFVLKIAEFACCLATCIVLLNSAAFAYERIFHRVLVDVAAGYILIIFPLFVLYVYHNSNTLYERIVIACGAILNFMAGFFCIVNLTGNLENDMNLVIITAFTFATGLLMLVDFSILLGKKKYNSDM